MTPDQMKTVLDAFDLAMKAEGIGPGVRERVARRLVWGTPEGYQAAVIPEPEEPAFRTFLRAARREMPVRQNSMLRPV